MHVPSSRVASGWKLEAPGAVHPAKSYLVRVRVRVRVRLRLRVRVAVQGTVQVTVRIRVREP